MNKCLADHGVDLCQCSFESGKLSLSGLSKTLECQYTHEWIFNYQTLRREPGRQLCRIALCKQCGKYFCSSESIAQKLKGARLLNDVFERLRDAHRIFKPEYSQDELIAAFESLFSAIDRKKVIRWLRKSGHTA